MQPTDFLASVPMQPTQPTSATEPYRIRLADTGDDAARTSFVAVFELPGLPPIESHVTVAPDEVAAGDPGNWFPHPNLPGHSFRWWVINRLTGDAAFPCPAPPRRSALRRRGPASRRS